MKHRFGVSLPTLLTWAFVSPLLALTLAIACGESSAEIAPGNSSNAGILPPTATPTPPGNEFPLVGQPEKLVLEDVELVGLDGWINSDALSVDEILEQGRLVLIDFWTYTCVNCVRTFPYLNAWHEAYGAHGLTVVGVHSPEFEFEKLPANVQQAVDQYGIEYPVALDGNKQSWERYGNHFWPSKYLIGTGGEIIFRHFGEGAYDETESVIREALELAGHDISEIARSKVAAPERSQGAHTVTRELYGGYANNLLPEGLYAGQDAYYEASGAAVDYVDDGTRRHGQFYLDGRWVNEAESIVSGSAVASRGDNDDRYFAFEFFATAVNAVIGHDETKCLDLLIELDGRPLTPIEAGQDISWDNDGNSVLTIEETRLYQIVELPEFGKHELKLKTNSEGLAIYTVTFGVFEFGP